MTRLYVGLCVIGAALPLSQFLPWVAVHGLDVARFLDDLLVTAISRFFAADLVISAIVLILFVLVEGRRAGVKALWAPILGTVTVGVSFGLPLFLALRERALKA